MVWKKKSQANPDHGSQSHLSIPMQPVEPIKDSDAFEFEPLPTPVDFSGMKPTARYQTRALARRALSFHSRQRITSVFCLIVWPILMAILNYSVGVLISRNLTSGTGVFRMCVNDANPQTSRNVYFDTRDLTPEEIASGFNASYYRLLTRNFDDRESFFKSLPCVRWFGESHPNQPPYANGTGSDVDTYYTPGDFNWLNLGEVKERWWNVTGKVPGVDRGKVYPNIFENDPINQTVYYSVANADVAKALGTAPNVTQLIISKTWPPTNTTAVYNNSTTSPAVVGSGLLGAIPVRYIPGISVVEGDPSFESPYNDYVREEYTAMPNFILTDDNDQGWRRLQNEARFWRVAPVRDGMGSVAFETLDLTGPGTLKATLQLGLREKDSGLRQLIMISQLSSAMVKTKYAGKYVLNQGIRALPYEYDFAQDKGINVDRASIIFLPFALSFLLPTFVSVLVHEKENRLRVMMAMNGLKSSSYYLAHYLEFMTMQLLLTLIFALASVAMQIAVWGRTNTWLLILLLLLWAHVQVCFAFAIASVFSKTRWAAILVNSFVALSAILTVKEGTIFEDGSPIAWLLHPSFAFFHILSVAVTRANMVNMSYPLSFGDFTKGSMFYWAVVLLVVESFVFLLLAFYIDAVAPSEYGVTRPWHFFVTDFFKSRSHSRDPESSLRATRSPDEENDVEGGDAGVREELERVRTVYDPEQTPLILNNLYHRYPGKAVPALQGMSLGVEKNTVLGLLGPNGAGKSTMIHLLTGLYNPTSGTAYVAGASIRNQMALVHSRTGVCPQHDILWDDLTVADHLLFYSRLRGVPPSLEQQAVAYAIASVCLTKFRDRQVKTLSGGERRRVSIAISMLGDNRVIFLDEPTTGLDPAVRRVVWDIVNRVKVDRTIILTTHSMEEADILSDRIAIMSSGQLKCIGTSLHLKELYGSGFRLNVTSKPGRLQEACRSIEEKVLSGRTFKRTDKFTNATVFDFDIGQVSNGAGVSKGELSSIFKSLLQREQFPDVEDWGISQTTLEDVFIKIVTDADTSLRVPTVVQEGQF